MNSLHIPANNKVRTIKIDFDAQEEINRAIDEEYQTGWKVKKIIYIQHTQEALILFEREDSDIKHIVIDDMPN